MKLIEYLQENRFKISDKGRSAMAKAIKEVFPTVDDGTPDFKLVARVLVWELPEKDCLAILQLTARYAGLWAFA